MGLKRPHRLSRVSAGHYVSRTHGSDHSSIIEGGDGRWYVVRHPSHQNGEIEALCTGIYQGLGLSVPPHALVEMKSGFLSESRASRQLDQELIRRLEPGLFFGSLWLTASPAPVCTGTPLSPFERVINREDFWGAFVIDTWLGRTRPRRALFVDNASSRQFEAFFIGQSEIGKQLCVSSRLADTLYLDRSVYRRDRMMNRLHFWLEHLQRCGAAVLAQAIEALPAVWQKSAALSDSEAMLLDRLTRLEQSILPAAFASFPEEIGPRSFTSGGEDRRQPGAGMCEFKGCRAECGSNPMPATAEAREIEADLKDAIEKGQIAVHYQPEFEVRSLRLVRFEALARWRHPVKGMIPPDKFIPVAERTGHIRKLGRYVMEQACLQAAALQRAQGKGIQIAVNVSGIQLTSEGFVEEVKAVLRTTGLSPDLLQIELTESVLMTGTCRAVAAIERLSQMGVSIAVDDFGSGYSGFGYLNKLPVTAIKLDQSFAGGLGRFDKTEAMMESLITLARNLGINLIVEGVETAEQFETISGLGGREVQGYLLGTPMPAPIDLAASCSLVPVGKFPQLPFDDAPALPYVSELPKPSVARSRESAFAAAPSPAWPPAVSGS